MTLSSRALTRDPGNLIKVKLDSGSGAGMTQKNFDNLKIYNL
jgi:hypothetical protein